MSEERTPFTRFAAPPPLADELAWLLQRFVHKTEYLGDEINTRNSHYDDDRQEIARATMCVARCLAMLPGPEIVIERSVLDTPGTLGITWSHPGLRQPGARGDG